ncbi:MAG: tetratricopeptide repeat protein [Pseudomonadota bacterium]
MRLIHLIVVLFGFVTLGEAIAQTAQLPSSQSAHCDPSALSELRARIKAGDSHAEFILGELTRIGHCERQDYQKAARLLTASHEKGNINATYALSQLFADSRFEGASAEQSIRYLRDAAERGLVEAQHQLGIMLAAASVTDEDRNAAIEWLERAYHAGHGLSAASIGMYYQRGMHGFSVRPCLAYSWYSKAASVGFEPAKTFIDKIDAENGGLCALTH